MPAHNLLIRSADCGATGVFAEVSAAQAGWEYLSMQARRLEAGTRWEGDTGEHEWVVVLLGGTAALWTSRGEAARIGDRPNVFGGRPWAVYLPRRTQFRFTALSVSLELAACWVPTDQDHPLRVVSPTDCAIELRGGGNASRQITSIVPPGFDCHRLVAVEVYTPSGGWSSYPPHKHDVHRAAPDGTLLEADLEEIYFYKLDKPEGYAYQRVYTPDRRLDALLLAQQHDIVLVPEGYHPVVSAPGYTTYYLNFLAGSAQSLASSDDPAYAWVKGTWVGQEAANDPRLPIVR